MDDNNFSYFLVFTGFVSQDLFDRRGSPSFLFLNALRNSFIAFNFGNNTFNCIFLMHFGTAITKLEMVLYWVSHFSLDLTADRYLIAGCSWISTFLTGFSSLSIKLKTLHLFSIHGHGKTFMQCLKITLELVRVSLDCCRIHNQKCTFWTEVWP